MRVISKTEQKQVSGGTWSLFSLKYSLLRGLFSFGCNSGCNTGCDDGKH